MVSKDVFKELTNKWKMLEQFAAGERRLNESLDQLATDLNTLREHITSLEGECKFDHKLFEIDFKQVVPLLLKQFQVSCFLSICFVYKTQCLFNYIGEYTSSDRHSEQNCRTKIALF